MPRFDFITDEKFRTSLESDYHEMNLSLESGCWKSSHVLAGSITECLLINHLISERLIPADQALKIDFGTALKTCQTNKVISQKIADLSSVIKDYRNLIHPGRQIRLNETIDKNSADVAKALVEMVIDEIEQRKRAIHGYTAEQIISKLQRDSSADAIIPHLLKQSNQTEIERLLHTIPKKHLETFHFLDGDFFSSEEIAQTLNFRSLLETCFRAAFSLAPDELKIKTIKEFSRIIKEEDEATVNAYGTAFFRCTDIIIVRTQEDLTEDTDLIKKHLLKRLSIKVTIPLLHSLSGIGQLLSDREISDFVDPLIRTILSYLDTELMQVANDLLDLEWTISPRYIDDLIASRVTDWINHYKEQNQPTYINRLEKIKESHIDIPF